MTNKELRQKILAFVEEENKFVEEHSEFCQWVDQNIYLIEEGIFDKTKQFFQSIPEKFKEAMSLIKHLAMKAGTKIKDVMVLFKNSTVYSFFKAIGWNVMLLVKAVKVVMKKWTEVRQLLIDKLTELKPLAMVKRNWNKFCIWADKNIFKHMGKIGSLLLVGLLLWIWFNMSFTGDFNYDFDNSLVIKGVTEGITFSECFHNNFDLFMLLTLGVVMGGIPIWGPATHAANSVRITISLIYSLLLHSKDKPMIEKFKTMFSKRDAAVPPKKVANIKKKIRLPEAERLLEIEIETSNELNPATV